MGFLRVVKKSPATVGMKLGTHPWPQTEDQVTQMSSPDIWNYPPPLPVPHPSVPIDLRKDCIAPVPEINSLLTMYQSSTS